MSQCNHADGANDPAGRPCFHATECDRLLASLSALRGDALRLADEARDSLRAAHPAWRESARNLLHYLAVRRHDLRELQARLANLGLSSLGRAESHILGAVDALLHVLQRLTDRAPAAAGNAPPALEHAAGQRLLEQHAEMLLGPEPPDRRSRIMVTMPSEAADNGDLVRRLVDRGMDCMRINCAHDDAVAWLRMIEHLRAAEQAAGRSCRIAMDLAGPKVRTGPLEPGPEVVKVRPLRDALGRVVRPARVWLSPQEAWRPAPSAADASLPVVAPWALRLRCGDAVKLRDARGKPCRLRIVETAVGGCWGELHRSAYVVSGTPLRRLSAGRRRGREGRVGRIAPREQPFELRPGDPLVITRDAEFSRPARLDARGRVLAPAEISCTCREVFDDVRPGERIYFDDGKIDGLVERVEEGRLHVRIVHTRPGGGKLRSDRGINLPDSELRLSALTAKDEADLEFVARHADMVALSFANSADDVRRLQERLAQLGGRAPAIVLKIETQRGFANLPAMLLAAMRSGCCGAMIARGDLAVECGFERLAEVQEEILWLCEAAHVPVIWATQVLESMAKSGQPSRAEITDAAMSNRAECVMLNKGPYIVEAVQALDDILRRMQGHQSKKRSMLRELRLASRPLPADLPAARSAASAL
jgi:pyruvate kinase